MNTIILFLSTIIFILITIFGIFFMRQGFSVGISIGIILIFIGIFGLFSIGSTFIAEDQLDKTTICSYTVGKSDESCMDTYWYNSSIVSNKLFMSYIIIDTLFILITFREFLLIISDIGML